MNSISVVHDYPMNMGGSEAVFLHTLEALQDEYDVTAITAEPCDLAELNSYYNTEVTNTDFVRPKFPIVGWGAAHNWVDEHTSGKLGVLKPLQKALFRWLAAKKNYDLIIYTFNESPYGSPSIQYIHHPWFRRYPSSVFETPNDRKLSLVERLVSPLVTAADFPSDAVLLTNSEWTANELRSVYGIDAAVCPPPVQTNDIPEPTPDSERDNAVIMIGRIDPDKRQHLAFEIVEQVRQRGHDIDLTIVGPTTSEEYAEKVRALGAGRDWATVRGRVARDELVQLLATHRYGLHAHAQEHFGIAVAEMVAAGCLPLVPDDGGQVDIVENAPELVWNTPEEAAELLTVLCEDANRRERLRSQLPQIDEQYGPDRFQNRIREYVNSILSQSQPVTNEV